VTEDELFDKVRGYFIQLDRDATLLQPARVALTDIIRAHQSGPRPQGPYAVLYLLGDRDTKEVNCDVYTDIVVENTKVVVMTKSRSVEWLARLDVFASNATEYCKLFQSGLRSEHSQIDLYPCAVRRVQDVQRTPQMRQERWEGRALFEFELASIQSDSMIVDVIEQIPTITNASNRPGFIPRSDLHSAPKQKV